MSKPPIIGRCLKTRNTPDAGQILGLRQGDERLVSVPQVLKWEPPPVGEQRARAKPVLLKARALFKAGASLIDSIIAAGGGRIECEYARRALREVTGEPNLMAWSEHFKRTRHDVFRALDRAVALCSKAQHRGGWTVSARVLPGGEAA